MYRNVTAPRLEKIWNLIFANMTCACPALGTEQIVKFADDRVAELVQFAQAEKDKNELEVRQKFSVYMKLARAAAGMSEYSINQATWERRMAAYNKERFAEAVGDSELEYVAYGAALGAAWLALTDIQRKKVDDDGRWGWVDPLNI